MTQLQLTLTLPDNLAHEAEAIGLLHPHAIERLLNAEIRRRRINELFDAAARLTAMDIPPLSEAELEAEIHAARAERRSSLASRR